MTSGYRNPVLTGYHPDPTICRAGDDFYLTTSTNEWFPGLPVYHSRDLVHWRLIGHVLDRPSQLDLDGMRPSAGLYAPTIRYHDGTFYVICTLMEGATSAGHFVVTATDPAGPWSEPVWIDGAGFDPSLLFDDDGRTWFCACREFEPDRFGRTETYLREIDLATGEFRTEETILWRGSMIDARWAEGPHLYRIDGRYYLIAAEGGTGHEHSVMVARANEITGPYEGNKVNPVLTHRHLGRQFPVAALGHADLVQTTTGEWWAVALGHRRVGGDLHNIGRETFLVPVTWEDGWPVFAAGIGQVLLDMPVAPDLPAHPWPAEPVRDDFDAPELALAWQMQRTPRERWWNLTDRPGFLRLALRPEALPDRAQPSLVAQRQRHIDFEAAVAVECTPAAEHECAGLALVQNNEFHVRLVVQGGAQGRELRAISRSYGKDEVLASTALPDGPIRLGVSAIGQDYALRYATDGAEWSEFAAFDGRILSSEIAGGFTGVYIGPYASANGHQSTNTADFDWYEYRPLET